MLQRLVALRHKIFSPLRLTLFLTMIHILIYFDRGAIAAVLPILKQQYGLSASLEGVIARYQGKFDKLIFVVFLWLDSWCLDWHLL